MEIDFQQLFEASPDLYLVLAPDLTILGASNAYLQATNTQRKQITGKPLFETFPYNPDAPEASGASNLRATLNEVIATLTPQAMPVQQYDIRAQEGGLEKRYWSAISTPVTDSNGKLLYILHRVEDVTTMERLMQVTEQELKRKQHLESTRQMHQQQLLATEDRFMKIFNLCPVSLYIIDGEDRRFLQVNRAFEQFTQFSQKEVVGKTIIELRMTDERTREQIRQKVADSKDATVELEMDVRIATGELKHMLIMVEQIKMAGKPCFLVAMTDISKRKEMEDSLRETNNFLDAVLQNIPDMVFVKDAQELKFMRFNKAGEQMLGYTSSELIGKNDYDFFTKEQADFFTARDRDVFASGQQMEIAEEPIQTATGERWLHTRKIPVYDNGKPMYLVGISADITERRKQRHAIMQLNKELEAFTYSVSHDLRAPLRAVTGYARILDEDYAAVLDDDGRRMLAHISNNAERMGQLIDDLLNFSRLGRKELQKADADMDKLADSVVSDISRSVAHKAIINIGKLHRVHCDPALMTQVLLNLLNNAIKYSSKREDPIIGISSELREDFVVFTVSDNGAGFDMRYVNKLFGVFQRLHSNEEFEGTGVGLAIVQRIIDKHGGKVWAEGRVNEGASFCFSVPIS